MENRVPLRVVHFLNQFFGGLGGESEASSGVQVKEGPVGPGRALEQSVNDMRIVATVISGDNYFNENPSDAEAAVRKVIRDYEADVVLAGPAFNSGRYGLACARVCRMSQAEGIPAVSGMYPENPGVLEDRGETLIVATGDSPGDMQRAVEGMARLARKLVQGEELGPAEEEGYIPRGVRRPGLREKPAAERAYAMLLRRVRGEPFTTEMAMLVPEEVAPAEPLGDLSKTTLALITTGGLVPKGNPDRLVRAGAKDWFTYRVDGLDGLSPRDWESVHAGFYTGIVNEHPDYVVPVNIARDLEQAGVFHRLHGWLLSTTGVGTTLADARRIGQEMAEELKAAGVDGCCLVAT